jgi:hypothetical protein
MMSQISQQDNKILLFRKESNHYRSKLESCECKDDVGSNKSPRVDFPIVDDFVAEPDSTQQQPSAAAATMPRYPVVVPVARPLTYGAKAREFAEKQSNCSSS